MQIALHLFFLKLLQYQFEIFVITSRGVIILKRTLLMVNLIEKFDMEKINDIKAEQLGLIRNLFNYGDLKIKMSMGQTSLVLEYVDQPSHYQEIIDQAMKKASGKRREVEVQEKNEGS